MSNAPTKKPKPDEENEFLRGRIRVTRPGKARGRVTLRTVRVGLGQTQVDVAEGMGIQQGEVSRIERRRYLDTLKRYAEALGLELDVALVDRQGRRFRIADPEPGPDDEGER